MTQDIKINIHIRIRRKCLLLIIFLFVFVPQKKYLYNLGSVGLLGALRLGHWWWCSIGQCTTASTSKSLVDKITCWQKCMLENVSRQKVSSYFLWQSVLLAESLAGKISY